jgi:hypothetical protein
LLERLSVAGQEVTPLELGRNEVPGRDITQVVRFRANLSVPLEHAGQTIYPFGWNGTPQGGFEVSLSLSGLFDYPVASQLPARSRR